MVCGVTNVGFPFIEVRQCGKCSAIFVIVASCVSCFVLILLSNSFGDLCLGTVFSFFIVIIRCPGMFCFLVGPFYLFPYFVNGDSVKC